MNIQKRCRLGPDALQTAWKHRVHFILFHALNLIVSVNVGANLIAPDNLEDKIENVAEEKADGNHQEEDVHILWLEPEANVMVDVNYRYNSK